MDAYEMSFLSHATTYNLAEYMFLHYNPIPCADIFVPFAGRGRVCK